MIYYATLAEAKSELKAGIVKDDSKLAFYLNLVSRRIDQTLNTRRRRPIFGPYQEQRSFAINTAQVASYDNTFNLRDNLLAITTVLQNTTDITANVEVYPPDPSPYRLLRLTSLSRSWYDNAASDGTPLRIYVTGAWGRHNDYTNAWLKYDDLAANITDSVLTLTVDDAKGDDPYGFTPRFSVGSFIRIGTEWMEVTAVNYTSKVLTVRRGVHGSTAAAHTAADDIDVWQVEDTIKRVVIRQAAMMYARRGAFQVETIDGIGSVSYPQDLLTELKNVLSLYAYG